MRKIGISLFLIANFHILIYYIDDIIKYYSNKYNYDGIRYLVPLAITDVIFVVALILIGASLGWSKRLLSFIILIVLHNSVVFTGIENIPFAGLVIVIASIIYVFIVIKKGSNAKAA